MSRDPGLLCSIIQAALLGIYKDFNGLDPTRKLFIVETARSAAMQKVDFLAGRSQRDGYLKLSMHQVQLLHGELAAHAVDFGVLVRGHYAQDRASYEPLMGIIERHGLRSGLDWNCDGIMDVKQNPRAMVDGPHAECWGNLLTGAAAQVQSI